MLPTRYRLPALGIARVMKSGRSYRSPLFLVRWAPNDAPVSQFAFVVSTKVDKRAVYRNTVKRALRDAVRPLLSGMRSGFAVVIVSYSSKVEDLDNEIATAFQKIGII